MEKDSFRPVGEPIKFGIGVLDGDERVAAFDDGAFLDGADAQRKAAAVFGVERFEAFVIERLGMAAEVSVSEAAGFLDVVEREDLAGEIGFYDVLEHGQHCFFKHAPARLDVGVDVAGIRRVLPPVGQLVRVGVENRIQAQGLHGTPLDRE